MPYYAAMAILGSMGGCLILYFLGRKGGEAAFRAQAGDRATKIEHWVQRNGFVSMLIAALAPPPMPLKFFVLAAGALKMPVRQFTLSLLLARVLRFYVEGYLAVRYGPQAAQFLIAHKVALGVATVASIIVSYLFVRLLFRQAPERQS